MKFAAPIVFAPKKDGFLYFFPEYWKLNVVSARKSSSIWRMGESVDLLGAALVFLTLDASCG